MNKQDYRKAMNRIKISDSFQARTAQLMQEVRDGKAAETSEENTRIYPLENEKRRFASYIKYGVLIAAVAVISFTAGVLLDPLSDDGITAGPSDPGVSETVDEAEDEVVIEDADAGSDEERKVEAAGDPDAEQDDSLEEFDQAAPVEDDPLVGIAPSMAPVPNETADDTVEEVPVEAEPEVDTTAAASEWELMRSLLDSGESIGGFAENGFYILAAEKVKAPLGESNSEHTEIAEFPAELISMTADILENSDALEQAVSPEEYAKDSKLYMPLNWNGTTFVFGFHNENHSFTFTVCGRSITSLNSGLSYTLTEEEFLAYSDYSVKLVGGTLIPAANPAAEETFDTEE